MKKVLGIIVIVAFALTMFLNSNTFSFSNGVDLTSLISLNHAEAETGCVGSWYLVKSRPGGGWDCFANSGLSCCPVL
ncbi:hypothetical protein [Maribacter sp. 2304DJ31-5]|uniref:hypothetical protein n=1 Tax=Maribacter sp. 2304DJ31-5 TaxID=3386273 RepID=UPI0039BD228F